MLEKLVALQLLGFTGLIFVSDYIHEKWFVTRKEETGAEDIRSEYTQSAMRGTRPISGSIYTDLRPNKQ
jgi:hypothetical protein